jgi:hypothetical protein
MDQLHLPPVARLLLLGNAMLVAPALWPTVSVLNHLESRYIPLTEHRAPFLAVLMGAILISIAMTWRGSHRAANWMLTLFSIFVAVCIWESATGFYELVRVGVDFSEFGILAWLGILWGALSFLWLGLNVWYFYGRWGMIPRTR